MSFASDIKEELMGLKMWDVNSSMKQDEQMSRLLIREAFIKSGFINNPDKDYHLEVLFKDIEKAEELQTMLNNFRINSKITKKGQGYIVYIKDGEDIVSFLALIGASKAVIKFEEIRVLKDARNNINRIVNCETANITKTMNAANTQIESIKYLKQHRKFETLPKELKEIVNLRIKEPDLSYEELGKLLDNPISKSGVSHRLNRINQIAKELQEHE